MNIPSRLTRLYKTVILEWLIIICFAVFFVYNVYDVGIDSAEVLASANMRIDSIKAKENIDKLMNELTSLSESMDDRVIEDPEYGIEYFKPYRERFRLRNLNFVSLDGNIYTVEGATLNISDREYFHKTLENQVSVSYVLSSYLNGDMINALAVPVIRDYKIIGILSATVNSEDLAAIMSLNDISAGKETLLFDGDGHFITGVNMKNTYETIGEYLHDMDDSDRQKLFSDMKNEQRGYVRGRHDGRSYIQYYSPTHLNNWWMMVQVPETEIYSYVLKHSYIIFIAVGVLMIFMTLLMYKLHNHYLLLHKNIMASEETDDICGGHNEIYLRRNISSRVEKDKEWTLIEIEVNNINNLFKLIGIDRVYSLLRRYYKKLETLLYDDEILAHVSHGIYKILIHRYDMDDVMSIVEKIENIDYNVKPKIGIFRIEDHNKSYERMSLKTLAAKNSLGLMENYAFYDSILLQKEISKAEIEKSIEDGMANDEFFFMLQPKYDVQTGKICGAEALARWYHDNKTVSPAEFIPVCEATGEIRRLDFIILDKVCKFISESIGRGMNIVPISINLSRIYINEENLAERLNEIVDSYGIDRRYIELELTETSIDPTESVFKENIRRLKENGYRVSLDDFGAGYSSMKTFAESEFDAVKLDKTFIDGIDDGRWRDMISFAIKTAKKYDVEIVAEGVETKEQYEFLRESSCDIIQGYYFSRPVNPMRFAAMIE